MDESRSRCELHDVRQPGSNQVGSSWAPLSDLAEINPRSPTPTAGETVSFVAMADVSESGFIENFELRKASSGYTRFAVGDVLVAKITPCFENGKGAHVGDLPTRCGLGSTEFHVLRPRSTTSDRYLYHLTRAAQFRLRGEGLMSGSAGQRRVPAEFFGRHVVRIPSLEEQRRIAEILDTIDETIRATERVIAKRRGVRAGLESVLLSQRTQVASTEDGDLHETVMQQSRRCLSNRQTSGDWTRRQLGELGSVVGGGTPSRENEKCWNGNIPWLTPSELTGRDEKYVFKTQDSITDQGLFTSGARLLPKGAILITSRASIGWCAIAGTQMTTNQGFKNIIPTRSVDSSYLYYVCRTLVRELMRRSSGTTFLEISRHDLTLIEVSVPPLEVQHRIVAILDTINEDIRANEGQLQKLRELRMGLATDLLSGRIRTVST